jgi:hypothetical protein
MHTELSRSRPPTLSTIAGYELQAAGHVWDAICTSRRLGMRALTFMRDECGVVIDDPRKSVLFWFVPCGTAQEWTLPGTTALGMGQHVVMPPLQRSHGPGRHWHIAPSETHYLTSPLLLRSSLQAARGRNCRSLEAS